MITSSKCVRFVIFGTQEKLMLLEICQISIEYYCTDEIKVPARDGIAYWFGSIKNSKDEAGKDVVICC